MPTPYPTSQPGYLPPRNLINVPAVIRNVMVEAGKDLAVESYYMGYEIGWDNATLQYIKERDIEKTVGYILEKQGEDPVEIDRIVACVKQCLIPPGTQSAAPSEAGTGPIAFSKRPGRRF